MKILITGATGLIGRALISRLLVDNHEIYAWARSPEEARKILPASVEIFQAKPDPNILSQAIDGCEAVVHLAGESIANGRWTPERKDQLTRSRVTLAENIVEAITVAKRRPSILITASGVGFYGDQGAQILDEQSPPGHDFLSQLCVQWEQASQAAEGLGVRVVYVRLGVVLAREGGVLAKLLPVARLGLAGPMGSGEQYMSWIHIRDVVEVFANVLEDPRYRGPVNATAPTPVTNKEFMQSIAKDLGRPCFLRVPAVGLRLALGEAASMLLGGQRVIPKRLHELNFQYQFPNLELAIENLIH